MVRDICRDTILLSRKSVSAEKEDIATAMDLADTLRANLDRCVGMAANMIGVNKRIIAIAVGPGVLTMLNPVILKKQGKYEAEEGCLSLPGQRKTTRYQRIEVEYYDLSFRKHRQSFSDFPAQIIQHEVDHCDGILI